MPDRAAVFEPEQRRSLTRQFPEDACQHSKGSEYDMKASVSITKLRPKSMMNLHHELGKAEINGHQIRFCQHINGACFWLSVDDDLYQVKTEELMDSVLNVVMEDRRRRVSDGE